MYSMVDSEDSVSADNNKMTQVTSADVTCCFHRINLRSVVAQAVLFCPETLVLMRAGGPRSPAGRAAAARTAGAARGAVSVERSDGARACGLLGERRLRRRE